MKIVKNNSILTDEEVICRVEAFEKMFSEIFPTPTGQHCFFAMPDGTVSSYSSVDPEIIVDYSG